MTQERPRVRMENIQYFDRNIWDMSIDITYFVLDILQVSISRSTYNISFERMCLTGQGKVIDRLALKNGDIKRVLSRQKSTSTRLLSC